MNHSSNDEWLERLEQVEEQVQNLLSLARIGNLSSNNSIDTKISTLEASIKAVQNKYQEVVRSINSRPSSTSSKEDAIQAEISAIRLKIEELSSLDKSLKLEAIQKDIVEMQYKLGDLSSSLKQKVNHAEIEDTVRQFDSNQHKISQIEDKLQTLQKKQLNFSPDEISAIQNFSATRENVKRFLSRILLLTVTANLVGLGLGLHFFIRVQERYRNYAALEMESYALSFNARLVRLEKKLDSFPDQAELQPELDTLRSEINQLKSQYQGLTSQDSNLQRSIQALEQQVQALQTGRSTTRQNDGLLW